MRTRIRRFALSGVLVTSLHAAVAAAIIEWLLPIPALANGVAFSVATLFSYLLNTRWSFSRPLQRKNLQRFVLVALFGCLLAVAVSGVAAHYSLPYWIGIGAVACVVPPVTFLLHNFWTYR
jgi:putative flippase GtrA